MYILCSRRQCIFQKGTLRPAYTNTTQGPPTYSTTTTETMTMITAVTENPKIEKGGGSAVSRWACIRTLQRALLRTVLIRLLRTRQRLGLLLGT